MLICTHGLCAVRPMKLAMYEHNTIIRTRMGIDLHCTNIIMTVSFSVNSLFSSVSVLNPKNTLCFQKMPVLGKPGAIWLVRIPHAAWSKNNCHEIATQENAASVQRKTESHTKLLPFPPKKCTMLQNLEFLIDHHRYSVISIKPMPVAKFQHYHCFFERYLSNPRKFSSNFLVSSMKSKSYTSSWTLGVSHI